MWLTDWETVFRIFAAGTLSYLALVFFLRASGKRTLSKLNAFDFVVTVAIGSSFATVLLSKNTPIMAGIWGLLLLVLLQYAMTWMSVRSKRWLSLIKSRPSLMLFEGRMMADNLMRERVAAEDVYAVLRQHGHARAEHTDGSMSVIADEPEEAPTCLLQAGLELPSAKSSTAPRSDPGSAS